MKDFPLQLRHPSGQMMTLERDRVLVGLKAQGGAAAATASDVLSQLGLVLEPSEEPRGAGAARGPSAPEAAINHTATRFWTRTQDGTAFTENRLAQAMAAGAASSLEWVAPVYSLQIQGRLELLSPLAHILILRPAAGKDRNEIADYLEAHGLEADQARSEYLGGLLCCIVKEPLEHTSIEVLDSILREDSDVVEEVRFETMPMYRPAAHTPNDPHFASQWSMTRIEAGGGGTTAWDLTRGDANVVVCILDEGCDLAHPDLRFSDHGINLGSMLPDGSPTGNHGTACAGIASAVIDNAAGVAGVAGESRVLPAAFDSWSDVEVATGIRYATSKGARVISMSFGWNAWDHAIIDPAIQEAFDANIVMCVATHNHNSAITYPATNPLVMACGASDQIDNRKSPASPDGEPWGSNFGSQMSVVAPGVRIPTTDRTGSDGYNGSGDYYMWFNGTSSATPHVAGLAALLLSRNPTLSNVQVRSVIEKTADKVGAVPYVNTPGYPNGTWNSEMGYGRINAARAVAAIRETSSGLVVGRTSNAVTHQWHTVKFDVPFDATPIVLTSIETFDGPDTAGTRLKDVTRDGFTVKVEEEQSADSETNHTTEVIGYLAIGPGLLHDFLGNVIGEAATLDTNQANGTQWHTVNLSHTFFDPVVFMQIMTFNGPQPAHVRLRNVSANSFEFQIEEWDYLDQAHTVEKIGFLAIEGRRHQLAHGEIIEAGTLSANHNWSNVNFGPIFASNPITLSHCQSFNGSQAVVTRERNVSLSRFQVRLQEEEANNDIHLNETIGYIAVERR